MEQTNVYKVYDEDWSGIMGTKQLRGFAIMQTKELLGYDDADEIEEKINSKEYIVLDDMKFIILDSMKDRLREIVKGVAEDKISINDITDVDAIEVLKLRYFQVDSLFIE